MKQSPLHIRLYWLLHRYNPFRAEVGLRAIGNPTPDAPVLVSGNYAPVVEELEQVLNGFDVWLLVVDSAGINVWCAAGVGDFSEHKIIDTLVATRISEKVTTRRLIISPLAAVGIDRDRLRRDGGFDVIWGPAHLDDLPAFLRGGGTTRTPQMRLARFPLRDRFQQAIGIMGVFAFSLLLIPWHRREALWFYASIAHAVFGTMLGYELLPAKYPANKTMLLAAAQAAILLITRPNHGMPLRRRLFIGFAAHLLIAFDMIGSTPFYKTTIAHWLSTGNNESLFQPNLGDKCNSCGRCIEVCPKGLFSRAGEDSRRVVIDHSKGCCECLACIKQCPREAIDNIGRGWKDDIKSLDTVSRFRPA
ncbi:MAG: 4Fe-4S binding protein [Candidatus Riflebacteria bacterium]|nr:4Fe-4S binding protein [Candidatus Riflebacteria bacterium]